MEEKHIFISTIEDLYLLSKDCIADRSNIALKRLENYKISAGISNKHNELESKHYKLFDSMGDKAVAICLSSDASDLTWLSRNDETFTVYYLNSKNEKVDDISINFPVLYSEMKEMYEKVLFLRKTIYILSLATSNHKNRSILERYRKYLGEILRNLEEEDQEEGDNDLSHFFDKTEELFSDKQKVGTFINRFSGIFQKIKTSEVGAAISDSIPEGSEINQETIKNTLLTVQNKLTTDLPPEKESSNKI